MASAEEGQEVRQEAAAEAGNQPVPDSARATVDVHPFTVRMILDPWFLPVSATAVFLCDRYLTQGFLFYAIVIGVAIGFPYGYWLRRGSGKNAKN